MIGDGGAVGVGDGDAVAAVAAMAGIAGLAGVAVG